jgi:signal peptidase II
LRGPFAGPEVVMTKRSYRWLLILLAAGGLSADLFTKYRVFRWLHHGEQEARDGRFEAWTTTPRWTGDGQHYLYGGRYDVVPGWFGLIAEYSDEKPSDGSLNSFQTWSAPKMPRVNQGALFGMGNGYGMQANTVYAVISVLAAIGIVVWTLLRGKTADGWISAALGLILGGTVGNLFDRVVFHGVRDFLYFYKIDWPVFNVADCCLVCGAIMLVLHAVFAPNPAKASVEPPAPIQPAI